MTIKVSGNLRTARICSLEIGESDTDKVARLAFDALVAAGLDQQSLRDAFALVGGPCADGEEIINGD